MDEVRFTVSMIRKKFRKMVCSIYLVHVISVGTHLMKYNEQLNL